MGKLHAGEGDLHDNTWRYEEDEFQKKSKMKVKDLSVTTISIGASGAEKIMSYDASKLLSRGPLLTIFCKGTVFTLGVDVYEGLLQYLVACAGCAATIYFLEVGPDEVKSDVVKDMIGNVTRVGVQLQKLTPFIFGLFLALSVNRWWEMRVKSLGYLMDSIIANMNILCNYVYRTKKTHAEQAPLEKDLSRILKYGVCGIQCVAMQKRGIQTTEWMVKSGLMEEAEADVLSHYKNRAVGCWVWIEAVGETVLERCGVAPPNKVPFQAECTAAVKSVSRLLCYSETQLPVPYVHLIVLLVFLNNLVMSCAIGLRIGKALSETQCHHVEDCTTKITAEAWLSVAMGVLHQLLIPPIFQALAEICFLVADPLGDDIVDFPIASFQSRVYNECKATMFATKDYWSFRRKEKALAAADREAQRPQPQPQPAAAPPPPAAKDDGFGEAVEALIQAEVATRMKRVTDILSHVAAKLQDENSLLEEDTNWAQRLEITTSRTLSPRDCDLWLNEFDHDPTQDIFRI